MLEITRVNSSQERQSVPEKVRLITELFYFLHDKVNDPITRLEGAAKEKNNLINDIAWAILAKRNLYHGQIDWTLQELIKTDAATNTETYNTLVTIGDPSSGPTTIIMVHHDTILVDKNEQGKIKCEVDEDGTIYARTCQDDTIHLAAILSILDQIPHPEVGAFKIIFTDHEENGCRGSRACSEEIINSLNLEFPVTAIALESTQMNGVELTIGIGHRGKFYDHSVFSLTKGHNPDQAYCAFFESLYQTQHLVYDIGEDTLGHGVGSSPCGACGYIDQHNQNGEVLIETVTDIRTNGKETPDSVGEILDFAIINEKTLIKKPESLSNLIQSFFDQLEQGRYIFDIKQGEIAVQSNTNYLHSSLFNPKNDETVMPVLYLFLLALRKIKKLNQSRAIEIDNINWGNFNKQNSNPVEGKISGSFDTTLAEILAEIQNLSVQDLDELADVKLDCQENTRILSDAVTPLPPDISELGIIDVETAAILTKLKAFGYPMNYMTDLGPLFAALKEKTKKDKKASKKYRPLIFGIGNPQRVHKDERVSLADRTKLYVELLNLVNQVYETIHLNKVA